VDNLVSRNEFRSMLASVVACTRAHLDQPGITPFTAEEVFRWFQQITLEDVRAVFDRWGRPPQEEDQAEGFGWGTGETKKPRGSGEPVNDLCGQFEFSNMVLDVSQQCEKSCGCYEIVLQFQGRAKGFLNFA
jgi:hypothetical protein